jgi:nitroreductase
MALRSNIIGDWFSKQSSLKRTFILKRIALSLGSQENPSVEQMASTLAAGLLAVFAEDMGLSTVELAGLLRNPRKDAIASLVTVLRDA